MNVPADVVDTQSVGWSTSPAIVEMNEKRARVQKLAWVFAALAVAGSLIVATRKRRR